MIDDWDDAYANRAHVPGFEAIVEAWLRDAAEYRRKLVAEDRARLELPYSSGERQLLDLFLPEGEAKGLAIFIHGGYWMSFFKNEWSHFADGLTRNGWAVAIPGYTLCPRTRIAGITREVGDAITHAAGLVDGPIAITGHSAGGHLTARMACVDGPLPVAVRDRVSVYMPISAVADLRPLLRTRMNETLHLDEDEAEAESPALQRPIEGARVECWVGADERPEFVRQNALLANIWTGLGANTHLVEVADRHHFNVIDDLRDPGSEMVRRLVGR